MVLFSRSAGNSFIFKFVLDRTHTGDLALALLTTLLTTVLVTSYPNWHSPLRVILGLFVVMVIPGYTLMTALFPARSDLGSIERVALSLGLSVAVVPLFGLLLNYTPWGIRLGSISYGLLLFVVGMAVTSYFRRARLESEAQFHLPFTSPKFRRYALLLVGVSAAFGGVIALASNLRPTEQFTEFYILGPKGKLAGYPTTLAPSELFTLTIGVGNHEGRPLRYHIYLPFSGQRFQTPEIPPGEQWEEAVTFQAPPGTGRTKLSFELSRPADPSPYRALHLFVDLKPAPSAVPVTTIRRPTAPDHEGN